MAAHSFAARDMESWGTRCCRSWAEIRAASGLPAGWRLFRAADAVDDGGLASRYPALARPSAPRVAFEGGVRGGNGAAYFPFALPNVVVDWHEKPSSVQCNGEVLRSVDGFRYTLNEALAQAVNRIDVELGQHRVAAMLFVLSDGWRWGKALSARPWTGMVELPPRMALHSASVAP